MTWLHILYKCINAINPLAPKFKIPAKTINAGDKMAVPWRQPMSVWITLSNALLQLKTVAVRVFLCIAMIQEDC